MGEHYYLHIWVENVPMHEETVYRAELKGCSGYGSTPYEAAARLCDDLHVQAVQQAAPDAAEGNEREQ